MASGSSKTEDNREALGGVDGVLETTTVVLAVTCCFLMRKDGSFMLLIPWRASALLEGISGLLLPSVGPWKEVEEEVATYMYLIRCGVSGAITPSSKSFPLSGCSGWWLSLLEV